MDYYLFFHITQDFGVKRTLIPAKNLHYFKKLHLQKERAKIGTLHR